MKTVSARLTVILSSVTFLTSYSKSKSSIALSSICVNFKGLNFIFVSKFLWSFSAAIMAVKLESGDIELDHGGLEASHADPKFVPDVSEFPLTVKGLESIFGIAQADLTTISGVFMLSSSSLTDNEAIRFLCF